MSVHFISDLHLQPDRPAMTAIFLRYLAGAARDAESLYILGDLFEYWIGDDASLAENPSVIEALHAVSAAGVALYYMHGNRDFLIGDGFAAATGAQLLPDPTVIDLYGTATLLMHGDTLCTDDTRYQTFRAQIRDPENQKRFLALPVAQRRQIATGLRQASRADQTQKTMEIMDVNALAVEQAMREHGVSRLIHGHTHRPAVHDLEVDDHPARRIVLSDWHDDRGSVLVCDETGCHPQELRH